MVDIEEDLMKRNPFVETNQSNRDKHDLEECLKQFQEYFVESFDIDELINFSFKGKINSLYIRPIVWKMNLGIIPRNQQFEKWIHEVTVQRNMFKEKVKTLVNLRKFSGDPLSGNSGKNGWNSFFQETELKKMITLDVSRTYQDKELFQSNHIKEMLINILFIWSKDNKEVSYKQGMNEILAVILLAIYPFYITDNHFSNNPNSLKTKIRKLNEEKDYLSISRELFTFVNCESYLQADLFILFNAIMSRGIVSLYNTENDERRINEEFSGKKKELFQIQYVDGIPMKIDNLDRKKETSPLQIRCNKILKEYLKMIDSQLFNYLLEIDVDPTIILVWLKCIFNREFSINNVIVVWDCILAYDLKEYLENPSNEIVQTLNLNMIDYISVAMLLFIRQDLLNKQHEECLQRLFKFPSVKSPINIIKAAFDVKTKIYSKLYKIKEKKRNKSEFDIISSLISEESNNTTYSKSRESISSIKSNKYEIISKVMNIIDKYKNSIEEKDIQEINNLLNNI